MSERFIRTRALLGDAAFQKLQNSRVAVFGLGGVGGYIAEALARSGVGALELVDSDTVDESNINRQLFALTSTVGFPKTQAALKRLKEINPDAEINVHELFYSPETADRFRLEGLDAVADAIDFFPGKLELISRSQKAGIKLVSCMGTGKKTDPSLLRVSDIYETSVCPLARKMRSELKKRGIENLTVVWSPEQPIKAPELVQATCGKKFIPSGAIVPAVAGLYAADAILKHLISD